MVVLWFEKVWISLKTWGNLFFFVENTVELFKKELYLYYSLLKLWRRIIY